MARRRFVVYLLVSVQKQGRSAPLTGGAAAGGRGVPGGGARSLVAEFNEIENAKSDTNWRQLQRVMLACRGCGSKLVIMKFDQLSRDAHFPLDFEKARIEFARSKFHAK